MWSQLEPTAAHLSFLILSGFLSIYALFSHFIRNRLHLSEPPLAILVGILFGPRAINALNPIDWGIEDKLTHELTRVILGLQVFTVGIELPERYASRHWSSVLYMLGPVMTIGWLVCAVLVLLIFKTTIPTALTIAACLTPTDPVLAASILSNSRFSTRVPARIKHLLSCESGCNDGVSFPFLYAGILLITSSSAGEGWKDWGAVVVLYQCVFGTAAGLVIGFFANRALRFAEERALIGRPSLLAFYLLLSILCVGIASTLGLDDFLVAFSAGVGFAHDGWFAAQTRESHINNILDLLLNSAFFVYLGTVLPWGEFVPRQITPTINPGRLVLFLVFVLVLRRIPIVLALKKFIPDIKTWGEALFCGHFGPMGVGAVFLAIEARTELEVGSNKPHPRPSPDSPHKPATFLVWPIVAFVVFGSTLVHGLSVAFISLWDHFRREGKERATEVGGETEPLSGMIHEDSEGEETQSDEDEGFNTPGVHDTRTGRITLSN